MATKLRVMTYNVHGCLGVDRVLSPERIAEVIAYYEPDVVALQELDAGRIRSHKVDQTQLIAQRLQMRHHFHPAIEWEEERYGDAILTRHHLRLVHAGPLPTVRAARILPRRGALWAAVEADHFKLQVINTHFGINGRERVAQARAILGHEWSQHPHCRQPVVICGDFNSVPGSQAYRRLFQQYREVRQCVHNRRRMRTFSTRYPVLRLDHIFISDEIIVRHVEVPRTRLTRVASDHFPLLADLELP